MDFLNPDKKKRHALRLMAGYILIAIAIAIGSLVLLFRTLGYDLDRKTGKVIQNGLVFLSAHPESARITLNNVDKGQTDTRLTVPAGQYSVVLKRDGYRDWKKAISLEGGSIERLVYPLLVPEKLTTKDQQLYGQPPALATSSPDRHWLLVLQPGTLDKFDVFDMNKPDRNSTVITLPAGLLTAASGARSLSLVEWSTDNRHLLLQHNFPGGNEFIVVDREAPTESVNLNKTFNINPAKVGLRDKNWDQYFFHDQAARTLQRAELKTRAVSTYLARVLDFKSYGSNMVMYISEDSSPGRVNVNLRDGDKNYVLRTLPAGNEYLLDLTQFDHNWYMVAGAKSEGRIYIYKNPQNALQADAQKALVPVSVLKINQPAFVSFSQNARFIAAQEGPNFAVYDSETDRRFYYSLPYQIPMSQKAEWMDGHRLSLDANSRSLIFDFDGLNQQALAPTNGGFRPFFDRDYVSLYNIAPSAAVPGRFAVTYTDMKLN